MQGLECFVSGQLEECRLGRGSGVGGGGNFCERTPRDANVVKIEVGQVAAGEREREREREEQYMGQGITKIHAL